MRRLMVSVLISVDGRYRGPGGDLSVIPVDEAFNAHNLGLLEKTSTLVYGGRWFPENQAHWRPVAADPASGERDRRVAHLVTATDSLVISDSFVVLVGAGLAGAGDSLCSGAARELRLIDATVLPDSPVVRLRYDARPDPEEHR